MANLHTINPTFNQILKSPHVYALITVVSLLWFFVYKFGDSNDELVESLRVEIKAVRAESAAKDLRIENLTDAILYYRGVNIQIREEADSLVRAKVGKESLEIVKKENHD